MNPNVPNQPQPVPPAPPPTVVHVARPMEPVRPPISDEQRRRHEESVKRYPMLHLSEGEYVISDVHRHIIGLIAIWSVAGLAALVTLFVLPWYAASGAILSSSFGVSESALPSAAIVSIPLLALFALFGLGAVIATIVYRDNRFFLTNESVIQHIRTSLFSKKEQTVSLLNIEDASYLQHGILPTLLNYGSLRLSTQGDETTYRFQYVSNPKEQVMRLNDAVEAFKNGRPIDN